MKYYKLMKDLPIFKKGELFFVNDYGQLISCAHEGVVAYSAHTLKRFPDVLKDWFVEVPASERDSKTKYAFMKYKTRVKLWALVATVFVMVFGAIILTGITLGVKRTSEIVEYDLNCLTEPRQKPLEECKH